MKSPSTSQIAQLRDAGFVILPDLATAEFRRQLQQRVSELFDQEGDRAGWEFKQETGSRRLANVINKGAIFQQAIAHPAVLPLVRCVLGDDLKLSSLNVRSANPHNNMSQPLHCDMGAVADERGFWVCNVVWMLDAFTPGNGALRVVPGSHLWRKLPQDALTDLTAPHPDEVRLTGTAGTVIVINAHLWHGGMANTSDHPRTALHAFYCRGDKPQQQYQKHLLDDDVQANLSAELRRLLALDDPRNDALSKHVTQRSGFLK